MLHTLQKQVGCYNNKMVTLVAIKMSLQLVCMHDQLVCMHTSWRESKLLITTVSPKCSYACIQVGETVVMRSLLWYGRLIA